MTQANSAPRYHYIDWLRITAFLLLILYHSARAFFPEDPWHISNDQGSWLLRIAMDLMARWRLPLLFFISGVGTWFLLSHRRPWAFIKNRLRKLLLPLLFAMAVIVPPQVWLERVFYGQTDLGFARWWLTEAFTKGTYSEGNISWHHLWYIAYLLVITLGLAPLLVFYHRGALSSLNRAASRLVAGPQVLLIVLLPLLVENTLMRLWPARTLALLDDWGWLSMTASWFLIGFLVSPFLPSLTATAQKLRWITSALWAGLSIGILALPNSDDLTLFGLPYDDAFTVPIAWFAILALIGWFSRLVNKDSPARRYLNTAIYPLYILHQTVALGLVFWVVPSDMGLWLKIAIVAVGTYSITLLLYHVVIRNLGPARILFGLERR